MTKNEVMDAYGNVVCTVSTADTVTTRIEGIPFEESVQDFIRTRERLLGVSAQFVYGAQAVVKNVQIPFSHQRFRLRLRKAEFAAIVIRFSPAHHEEWVIVEIGNVWVPGYRNSVNKNSE
jgi:hypothetical protein